MRKKLVKTIVIDERDYILNIFIEKRSSVRASFTNGGINIRIPKHLSTLEQNKAGKEMLDWAVAKIKDKPEKFNPKEFSHGDEFYVLGRRYTIDIERRFSSKNFVKVVGEEIRFKLSDEQSEEKRQEYMRQKVRKILTDNHLDELSRHVRRINEAHFGKDIGKVSIKHTTSRWGQCFVNNGDLDFSTRLLLAPLPVIEYVIVHELCHLIHADHSRRFWNLVGSIDPNYKRKVAWLKRCGHELIL